MAQITYDDKVAIISNPNPDENKWTADDANEVKTVVNANATAQVNKSGDETIAGVKTFSSDPIIPDEAYDATNWNGSLEPPTKNAVRDKIESMGAGAHTIEDEGTPLTQRSSLNFVGAGVAVTDAGGKTVVTIPDGGAGKADLASPTFTGTPAAPTASVGTNTTQLATTAFVRAEVQRGVGNILYMYNNFT